MIQFFTEAPLKFNIEQEAAIGNWIEQTILAENKKLTELSYIFCTDDYLLQINEEYLNHNTFTDIITFDNSDEANLIEGDIFISIERVRENAQAFQQNFQHELSRVIIHGVLHLIGYRDKTEEEVKTMRQKEDQYLLLLRL